MCMWIAVEVRGSFWGGIGSSDRAYIVRNVGREGWCVIAAKFHTLVHVLADHMNFDMLMG